jgi:hypothetical protein
MLYCAYWQAEVVREQTWFLVAVVRSYEYLAFDRTLDKKKNIFEFFVPIQGEVSFIKLLARLQEKGVILTYRKLENRIAQGEPL